MSGLFWQGQTLKDLNNYSLCARTRIGLGKCVPCRLVTLKKQQCHGFASASTSQVLHCNTDLQHALTVG